MTKHTGSTKILRTPLHLHNKISAKSHINLSIDRLERMANVSTETIIEKLNKILCLIEDLNVEKDELK